MGIRLFTPLAALVGAVLAGGLIAGCANGTSTGAPATPGGSVSTSPSPSAGSTSGSPGLPTPQLSPSGPSVKEMTLTGTVEEGVEPRCIVLRTDAGKTYLLLGGDRTMLTSGAKLWVRGRPQPGMATTCQQGEPFQVLEAHPA